jgi:hypothetical protein
MPAQLTLQGILSTTGQSRHSALITQHIFLDMTLPIMHTSTAVADTTSYAYPPASTASTTFNYSHVAKPHLIPPCTPPPLSTALSLCYNVQL